MRTKVVAVEPYHLYDPKKEFAIKIERRLSSLKKQKVSRKQNNPSSKWKCALTNMHAERRFKKSSIFERDDVSSEELLPFIDSAMKLQQDAYDAVMGINRSYELQLLLIFLESFISIVFNCYFMVSVFVQPSAFKLSKAETIGYLMQHLIQPSLCILIAVLGFSLLEHVFRKTRLTVNKLIIHSQDKAVKERLLDFSQQMAVNIPSFTVYGFFSLDGSVIFGIISATTTYLIILIQALGSESTTFASAIDNQTLQIGQETLMLIPQNE